MKHIAVCIAAVVTVATPAMAQNGAPPPNQSSATSAPSRTAIAGRFGLELANDNRGAVDQIDEAPSDENAPPTLTDQAAAQARTSAAQAQLPPPQAVRQSRQVQTQPRVRPNL